MPFVILLASTNVDDSGCILVDTSDYVIKCAIIQTHSNLYIKLYTNPVICYAIVYIRGLNEICSINRPSDNIVVGVIFNSILSVLWRKYVG